MLRAHETTFIGGLVDVSQRRGTGRQYSCASRACSRQVNTPQIQRNTPRSAVARKTVALSEKVWRGKFSICDFDLRASGMRIHFCPQQWLLCHLGSNCSS